MYASQSSRSDDAQTDVEQAMDVTTTNASQSSRIDNAQTDVEQAMGITTTTPSHHSKKKKKKKKKTSSSKGGGGSSSSKDKKTKVPPKEAMSGPGDDSGGKHEHENVLSLLRRNDNGIDGIEQAMKLYESKTTRSQQDEEQGKHEHEDVLSLLRSNDNGIDGIEQAMKLYESKTTRTQQDEEQATNRSSISRTSDNAVSSLIYGVVGIFFFGIIFGPLAIWFGLRAKSEIALDNRIQQRGPKLTGSCQADAGIICGIHAIIIWFIAMVYYVVNQ